MIRLIVTSQTYRQSSIPSAGHTEKDPLNKLFARQSRWRLPAELIRDNALVLSGLLTPKIGGPSVKPYQPQGYWQHLNFPTRTYQHDANENQFRRGLYTHWQRTFLHPSLLAFDAPTREECTAERAVSNTPKAALTLLNDPSYVEAARAFAQRILTQGGEERADRIRWAWRVALSREPSEQEVDLLGEQLEQARFYYQQQPQRADELLSVGSESVRDKTDPAQLAAWSDVARVLLNLNEAITRN